MFTIDWFLRLSQNRPHMISSLKNRSLAAVVLLSCLGAFDARGDLFDCGVDLGAAGRTTEWAAFSLGGSGTHTNFMAKSDVFGDVGVAGKHRLSLFEHTAIHGDLYYNSRRHLHMENHVAVAGDMHNDGSSDTLLNQGVIDANNASDAAFALPVSPQYASLTTIHSSMTISGSDCVVLKLTDFVLNGNDILTLEGTAGTAFIINVSKQFSLSGNAQIVLSGGVQWDDVLFNVRGKGSAVSLNGKTSLQGILMANRRTVNLNGHATVTGEVIANQIKLNGNSQIIHPPIASQ
jgi:choice-of-anchor A domain-containing protein